MVVRTIKVSAKNMKDDLGNPHKVLSGFRNTVQCFIRPHNHSAFSFGRKEMRVLG